MKRESSKCRGWERERRQRLNEAFSALAKVLPCYDPCVTICKIDILTKATSTIIQQQDELTKIVSTKGDDKNFKVDVFKRLQEKIKKLKSRNEQLRDLLAISGISIPKSVGSFQVKNNRFKKASPEQVKIFQKIEMEKENKIAQKKKMKISTAKTLKRPKTDNKSLDCLPPKKRKSAMTGAAASCLIVLPQPSVTAGINNSCFLIPNQHIIPTKTMPSATGISTTLPVINPPLSSLGPGTLVLSNGAVFPIIPKQQVLLSNHLVISKDTKYIAPNAVPTLKSSSVTIMEKCDKSIKPHPIKPKCVTNTTQINKVPIPALTSMYANNHSLLSDNTADSTKGQPPKSKVIPKCKRVKVCKKKIEVIKDKNDDSSNKQSYTDEIVNESEKIIVSEESIKANSSVITTTQSTILSFSSSDEINLTTDSISTTSPNQDDQKICDPRSTEENGLMTDKENHSLENVSGEQVGDENSLQVPEKTAPENIDISHPGENLSCSASSAPCDDGIKNLGLNLVHSELSNDLFASLHVPPGCQNPESTSPTAAFLMAFPLVSSVKATDVNDDDHSSQRQTPTLLQIGTMDSTKHTHTDTLAGSLLNLDSFSFFNSKDVCENYYESCTNNITKENQINSSEMKNNVETGNVDKSSLVATGQSNSLGVPQKTDLKASADIHYEVFHNSNDNHETNDHQYNSTGKIFEEYNSVKSSINNGNDNKGTEIDVNKDTDVLNIVENVSCHAYPEFVKDKCRNKENIDNVLGATEDNQKKEQAYNEPVKPNNYGKNQNPKDNCYQNTEIKETQEYNITCQESGLKNLSDVTFPVSGSNKETLKINHFNMFQESSGQTVTDSNEKMSSGNEEMLCDYTRQQVQNPCIDDSSNQITNHHTLMNDHKGRSSKELFKKPNVNYEHHQNMVSQGDFYKSFHNIPVSVMKKKHSEGNTNVNSYIHPRSDLKHSNNTCSDVNKNSVNTSPAIMEKGNTHLYSVDNMSFNNFQMEPIQRSEIKTCEKPSVNNKPTENIALNIFETTQPAKAISSSGKVDNSNTGVKLSHNVQHQNYKKDISQKTIESQCYYSTSYPDNSYNTSYKSDGSKLCPTCSYMNLNKSYSNPLYTNSTTYNYYPDGNISQNYYKTSASRTDTKSYYSLNYENYQEYKKSEGNNFSKCYGSSSIIQRDRNFVDQTNATKEKCVAQNKLVNWMTTPENKVQPPDAFLTFPNQSHSFTSCVGGEASDIGNILEPKKNFDVSLLTEDKQFSWSQSKLPNFLDQTHNFVTPTLPTLVGDLALGNPVPFNDQKIEYKSPKDQKRKNNTYENQSNFLSVSQLVDHNKVESAPPRITARRSSSGGKSKNTVQMKNKRPAKNEINDKVGQTKPTNVFNAMNSNGLFNDQKSGNHSKNTSSSYSAEALIGNQIPDTPKKFPSNSSKPVGSSSFLTENIITHFPIIEENYMNQNQNFQNNVYTNNPFQTTNHSSISTNNFIYTTPTITSTYLSGNFEAPCYEYTENFNVLSGSALKDNKLPSKNYKQPTISKDEKNVSYSNCNAKKSKRKIGNESINSGFANFEFPLLPIPGSTNSPILPDDFHTHTSFLPPTAPYPAKPSMYQKQGNDFPPNGLLPLPGLPRNNSQHTEVSPSLNSVGTSLTNFNLSTIFPEINKGNLSNVYQDNRNKDHSSSIQMPFNLEPKYTFSG